LIKYFNIEKMDIKKSIALYTSLLDQIHDPSDDKVTSQWFTDRCKQSPAQYNPFRAALATYAAHQLEGALNLIKPENLFKGGDGRD